MRQTGLKLSVVGILLLGLLGWVGSSAYFGQGTGELAPEQILRMGVSDSDIQNLDPQLGGTVSVEGPVMRMLYSGLVRYPVGTLDFANIEGDLAEDWERSEDGLEWTFYLREGVMFHKGYGEFTAEDVKFSLDRNLLEGSPWRGDFEVVDTIEVVDKYVVKIVLKRADPFFLLRILGYHGGWITSKKAVEELGDVRLNPVGTGPF